MTRTLLIIAGAALVLCLACLGGAAALGGRDMARHGWAWTVRDDNGESVRIERVRGGGSNDLGPRITRNLAWSGETLTLDSSLDVDFVQGAEAGVVVTGPKGLADRVRVENGRIFLAEGDERVVFGWGPDGLNARSERGELSIVVTAPRVSRFDINGSGDLTLRNYDQPTLAIGVNGSADVTGTGKTQRLELEITGSGDVDLGDLTLTDAAITINGSGEARAGPTGKADIDISGSGDVTLTRRPAQLNRTITGSGAVEESF
ncbi:MAG TPA: DUF2807 domain-containing protein [Brevundimonas sp.]|uniref:GIN domain-containing protein n=1 Tax=Brevundimonas sp. TaxID=1871086 RepID=UPI002628DE1D|nr:DUF2807 domain-containing protein [Brevundimonas sp.]HRO33528.1 DUF2807 domain-containing protein [Brevundimonas sp.]